MRGEGPKREVPIRSGEPLSPEERALLERSYDPSAARHRLRAVIISGTLLAVALLVASPLIQSWEFLLFFAVAYIAVSSWERVRCARTILAYQDLVRRLSEERETAANGPMEGRK